MNRWQTRRSLVPPLHPGMRPGTGMRLDARQIANPPPPLTKKTSRIWLKDRAKLTLDRLLPAGSVSVERLRQIDPGFFYAWNGVLERFEVWCDRPVIRRWQGCGIAHSDNEPYYVMRVSVHPKKIDNRTQEVLHICPARPLRYKNALICPPSCPGVYYPPDERLYGVLWRASYFTNGLDPQKVAALVEGQEEHESAYLQAALTTEARNVLGDIFPQVVGIQSVAVPA